MESKGSKLLKDAIGQLIETLKIYRSKKPESKMEFLAVSKAFEVAVEYGWKELKTRVQNEGLDAPSPKAAIREAARIGMIDSPEIWIEAINARNDSVHNYFGIPESDYIKLSNEFIEAAGKIIPIDQS